MSLKRITIEYESDEPVSTSENLKLMAKSKRISDGVKWFQGVLEDLVREGIIIPIPKESNTMST